MQLGKQILVLSKEKYLFFLNAKCASSSIRRMAIYDLGYGDPLQYITDLNELGKYLNYMWIYLIREPWERLVSLWKDKIYRKIHHDFRRVGFSNSDSLNDFGIKLSKVENLITHGAHLWPMNCLYSQFLQGGKKQVIDIGDWQGWPVDLPGPRWDNKNKIKINPKMSWIKPQVKERLIQAYKGDFELYETFRQ